MTKKQFQYDLQRGLALGHQNTHMLEKHIDTQNCPALETNHLFFSCVSLIKSATMYHSNGLISSMPVYFYQTQKMPVDYNPVQTPIRSSAYYELSFF